MSLPALDADDFQLFGLPARQAQDRAEIDRRWKELQAAAHPDRHAAAGAAAQRVAMQWAVRINEAHRRLKDPLQRAALLCELAGAPIEAERNTAMPADFLMQQMAWREALDEAGEALPAIEALDAELQAEQRRRLAAVEALLDGQPRDAAAAAREVRALMFIKRFAADVQDRLDALGQ